MPSSVSFQPYVTTVAQNPFLLQTDGYVQGTFQDSPVTRYALEGGIVSQNQASPIWGGLPLTLAVNTPNPLGASSGAGPVVTTATAETNIDAWCLLNQAAAGIITSSSNSPLFASGSSINFGRTGSGMLVVLPVNPNALNTIEGGGSNQNLYWNFTNNYVDITGTGLLGVQIYALNTNSKTITYASGTGFANWSTGAVIVVRI